MEEVRSIGSLPCLEHVALLNNPLSIIPDYRTKVLAQFGERASEVSCRRGSALAERRAGWSLAFPGRCCPLFCASLLRKDSWPRRAFQFREACCLPRNRLPCPFCGGGGCPGSRWLLSCRLCQSFGPEGLPTHQQAQTEGGGTVFSLLKSCCLL